VTPAEAAHRSVTIEAGIRKWINDWNENPRPFIWTKTADEILGTSPLIASRLTT
jgi:hypothetical protein